MAASTRSLALAATMMATGSRELVLRIANVNTASLIVDDRVVPVDGRANLLLRYRGKKRTFPYISAADVLSDRVPAGTLKDKMVFVGTTALGTREVVATPLDTLFAGVEVQATIADNLLQQDFISRSRARRRFSKEWSCSSWALRSRGSWRARAPWPVCSGARSASLRCGISPAGCSRRRAYSSRRCFPRSA